jgi:pimeloyl-ACP methyl ester carboxylesterase
MTTEKTARRIEVRPIIIAALAAILALSGIAATASAKPVLAGGDKPTILLVHGAWADPAGWAQVQAGLEKDGYSVVAPRLELLGIQSDADIVRAALDDIPGDKILVGHSYGGVVVSNASYGRSDVRALVYTAAFVPDEGDSIISLTHDFNPPAVLPHLLWTGEPFASLCFIESDYFQPLFAADLSPKKAAELNAGQQASSVVLLVAGSGPVGWHSIPSWYAVSAQDLVIDPAAQRWMAARAGATVIEFDDASHAGGYTHYATRFVKLIEQAAFATAG